MWQVWIQFKMWALFPLSHLHDLLLHRSAPILTSAAIYELFMNIFTRRQHFFTNAAVIKLDLMGTYFVRFQSFSRVLFAFWRTFGRWWAVNGFWWKNGNGGSPCASLEQLLCTSSEWQQLLPWHRPDRQTFATNKLSENLYQAKHIVFHSCCLKLTRQQ